MNEAETLGKSADQADSKANPTDGQPVTNDAVAVSKEVQDIQKESDQASTSVTKEEAAAKPKELTSASNTYSRNDSKKSSKIKCDPSKLEMSDDPAKIRSQVSAFFLYIYPQPPHPSSAENQWPTVHIAG